MDRLSEPLPGPQRIQGNTHHAAHHGRLSRRHRQRIPQCGVSGKCALRHRRRRDDPPIRRGNRRQLFRCKLRVKQLHDQHRTSRRNGRRAMHAVVHRRQRTIMRRHRATIRLDAPMARRAERQRLAAQGDTGHGPRRLSRSGDQWPAGATGFGQGKRTLERGGYANITGNRGSGMEFRAERRQMPRPAPGR